MEKIPIFGGWVETLYEKRSERDGVRERASSVMVSIDVCVIDPSQDWTIDKKRFASKSRNTPYHGMQVKGRAVLTFVNGHLVYDGRKEPNSIMGGENDD